ncbi:MAG: phosphatase PAP2 family protein [Ilumatobacteraceae bacterium]
MVLFAVLGIGAAVSAIVALAARRWPAIGAPRVSVDTIVDKVDKHPKVAHHLRQHFDPKTETGVALISATAVAAVAAVGVGVLAVMIREKFGLQSLDLRFAQYGADHATTFSTNVMRHLSDFGSTRGVVAIALVATLLEIRRLPSRSLPIFMTLVVGGQLALSNLIKMGVARARPDISRLTGYAGTSFPSGHSTAAAATFAAVALIVSRRRSRRTKIAAASLAAGLAVVVAGTRVMLGVHWFTDVSAGLLLGWGWFSLCSIAFGGRLLSFGVPVEAANKIASDLPPQTGNLE